MIADPYLDPAMAAELPWKVRLELMSVEDWDYVLDRYFAQETLTFVSLKRAEEAHVD